VNNNAQEEEEEKRRGLMLGFSFHFPTEQQQDRATCEESRSAAAE
jgi:hypothetical protein